jgi:hypothetical protein
VDRARILLENIRVAQKNLGKGQHGGGGSHSSAWRSPLKPFRTVRTRSNKRTEHGVRAFIQTLSAYRRDWLVRHRGAGRQSVSTRLGPGRVARSRNQGAVHRQAPTRTGLALSGCSKPNRQQVRFSRREGDIVPEVMSHPVHMKND